MLNYPLPGEVPSAPFLKSFYLREWARYIHKKLDFNPFLDQKFWYDPEYDTTSEFRRNWITKKNWFPIYRDMNEQSWGEGINTARTPDVTTQSWANLSQDWRLIICQAGHLGSLHRSSHELPNTRYIYLYTYIPGYMYGSLSPVLKYYHCPNTSTCIKQKI